MAMGKGGRGSGLELVSWEPGAGNRAGRRQRVRGDGGLELVSWGPGAGNRELGRAKTTGAWGRGT